MQKNNKNTQVILYIFYLFCFFTLELTILADVRKTRLLYEVISLKCQNRGKMHLVSIHISYENEYFYQCIITFWCLRDSKGPIFKIDDIDPVVSTPGAIWPLNRSHPYLRREERRSSRKERRHPSQDSLYLSSFNLHLLPWKDGNLLSLNF